MAITLEQAQAVEKIGGIFFDPTRHRIVEDNIWVEGVRHRARENGFPCWKKLFLYHHTIEDSFVLAVWANDDISIGPRAMCELIAMNGPPGHEKYNGEKVVTPDIKDIIERIRPASYHAQKAKETEQAEKDRLLMRDFKDAELRHKMVRDLGSHNDALKGLILSGMLPVSSEETDSEAFLSSALKDKGKCSNSAQVQGSKGMQ